MQYHPFAALVRRCTYCSLIFDVSPFLSLFHSLMALHLASATYIGSYVQTLSICAAICLSFIPGFPLQPRVLLLLRRGKSRPPRQKSQGRAASRLLPHRQRGLRERAPQRMLYEITCTSPCANRESRTFLNPSTTLACVSTTLAPSRVAGCRCPDKNVYMNLATGSSPCEYTSGQWILSETMILSCPVTGSGPTGQKPQITPTSSSACSISSSLSQSGDCGVAVNVNYVTITVKQPDICTISALQYSTKTAIPTGGLQIDPDQALGWGKPGSIWNFTVDDGARISTLGAECQGSSCDPDLIGTANMESSGNVTENADGVW